MAIIYLTVTGGGLSVVVVPNAIRDCCNDTKNEQNDLSDLVAALFVHVGTIVRQLYT
jgi:hypothetical protein